MSSRRTSLSSGTPLGGRCVGAAASRAGGYTGRAAATAHLPATSLPGIDASSLPSSLSLSLFHEPLADLGAPPAGQKGQERAERSRHSTQGRNAAEAAAGAGDETLRPASRAGAAARLDFWSHSSAPQLPDVSIRRGALEGAVKQAAAAEAGFKAEAAAAQAARHKNAALLESLADLAASEASWQQRATQAEEQLGQSNAALEAALQKAAQQEEALGAASQRVQRLLAMLGEQSRQLEGLAALHQESEGQKQQIADLKQELQAALVEAAAAQGAVDVAAAARAAAELELCERKFQVQCLQEQVTKQAAELRAAGKQLAKAVGRAKAAEASVSQQREAHAAAAAAQEAAHRRRKSEIEELKHNNRQQAIAIAELQAAATSANARLDASQQHNASVHRCGVAHSAAYGCLAAHAAGLHQQFARQLGSLRQLCRHLGLQLTAALGPADLLADPAALDSSSHADTEAAGAASTPRALPASRPGSAATVAAAVLAIESLRTELHVAVQLLDMQAASSEAQQLAFVPAGIADALAADLAGLPAELLSSPRLQPSSSAPSKGALVDSATASQAAAAGAAGSPGPAVALQAWTQDTLALVPPALRAAASVPRYTGVGPSKPALSAQMARMEARLQDLAAGSLEQAARAAAARQLHEGEREARQRAQERAVQLDSQLRAVQADLDATRRQRDTAEDQGRRLAAELRDAIYSLAQQCARQQGQGVSWAVRGLTSAAAQTQYCELWEANVGCACASCCGGDASTGGTSDRAGGGLGATSVLCSSSSSSSRDACVSGNGSGGDSKDGVAAGRTAAPAGPASSPAQVLSLGALQQQIADLYRAKALHDLAVARGDKPFLPLPEFVARHLAVRSGAEGRAVQRRSAQLRASVEAHAGVYEVAMFGLSTGMLEEAGGGLAPSTAAREAALKVASAGPAAGISDSPLKPGTTATAAVVPAVLYARSSRAAPSPAGNALPALRRFCAADWHAAYHASAARSPLPQPFNPAAADQIHPMVSEVHDLALSVPGVEQLMCWVLGGGAAACLPHMDLGLRLAENQAPQLYLLAVDSCRLLGLPSTPQLYLKSSAEAAAYYLMLPGEARLHGHNGSSAPLVSVLSQPPAGVMAAREGAARGAPASAHLPADAEGLVLHQHSCASLMGAGGSRSALAAAAAEGQGWQCALVLTSGLIDLLEPRELQAVMTGSLALHAALVSPAASGAGAPAGAEAAAQLAAQCRGMAALGTLGSLAVLCPDALTARLPHQMAPFLHSRILPLLRRSARHLSLYCDRVAAAAVASWRPVAAAAVKQATGSVLLRNELNLDAVLQQARELEGAADDLLPRVALREEGATLAAAGASWTLLRLRELLRWCASNGVLS
ncbi:hypothetical protein ABPG77_006367 [Micractinium sp. CCAP 211/92]